MSVADSIGAAVPRVDAAAKVTGRARYVDDLVFDRMLHAALVPSPYPHARIAGLDNTAALTMPGVHAVLTWRDIPGENQIGCVRPDQPLLVVDHARMASDRLAIVVADTRDIAVAAARAVRIDWQPLPLVTDVVRALQPDAYPLHPGGNRIDTLRVQRGDAAAALESAAVVVDDRFDINYQEHAYLETQGVIALPEATGMTLYGSLQCPFYVQKAVARALGMPLAQVRVIQAETGGAFGGKEDYPSEPAACAAVAAQRLGRPVKLVFDRVSDMAWSTKRHRVTVRYKLGAMRDGELVGAEVELFYDAGGYTGLSTIVAERGNCSCIGPYRIDNVAVTTHIVYTNNLFSGAFRGFGTPQVTFAAEAQIDALAQRLGLLPEELRRRNLIAPGDATMTGQVLDNSVANRPTFEATVAKAELSARRAAAEQFNAARRPVRRGIGMAAVMYGCCLHAGGQHLEGSGARLLMHADGSVRLTIGGTEIGQGAYTVVAQIAAAILGIPSSSIFVAPSDTAIVPDSGPTVASRTTIMSGNAVADAAHKIRAMLNVSAARLLNVPVDQVCARSGRFYAAAKPEQCLEVAHVASEALRSRAELAATGWYAPPPKAWDRQTGQGEAYSVYCFATHIAEVEVDLVSGLVSVLGVTAGHDVGRIINPALLTGQVEGGVVQGLGYALMENVQMVDGVLLNPGFTDYAIPSILDVPKVETVFVEEPYAAGPFGAKGIGEPSLIPSPAAIVAAVRDATGLPLREMPVTPERLLLALSQAGITPFDSQACAEPSIAAAAATLPPPARPRACR